MTKLKPVNLTLAADGARLKHFIQAQGLSQTQFANAMGVQRNLVTYWVRGQRALHDYSQRRKACLILDIRMDQLDGLGEPGEMDGFSDEGERGAGDEGDRGDGSGGDGGG